MKKQTSGFFAVLITAMCCITTALPVSAAELPEVSVPVTISLSGTLPYPAEDYTVVLKAEDAAYPMPSGTISGACTMTITGKGTKNFPVITYDRVGVYTYTIYQVAGTNKKCTYDETVYTLLVQITNKEDYSGLEATAVLYPDSDGEKVPVAEFLNKYKVELPADSPQTGDESSPLLYAVLLIVSMAVIVTLFLTRKRKQSEE